MTFSKKHELGLHWDEGAGIVWRMDDKISNILLSYVTS